MMRSLWSGISGLKVHQTKMDVIGNNISNVNTVGFRSSSVNFTDVFYQTTQGASGPNANTGAAGRNATQIGLGANLASVSVNMQGTGATNRTDRGMDLMISGDAFFIVKNAGATYFTKSGALDIDANGTLYCTTNGATVLGWQVDPNNPSAVLKSDPSELKLMSPENQSADPAATTKVTLSGNIDSADSQVTYDPNNLSKTGYPMSIGFYDKTGQYFTAKLGIVQASADSDSLYKVGIVDILHDGDSILKTQDETTGAWQSTNMSINFGGQDLTYTVDTNGDISVTGTASTVQFNGQTGKFVTTSGELDDGQDYASMLNLTLRKEDATEDAFADDGIDIDFSGLTMYATNGNSSVKPQRGDQDGAGAGNAAGTLNGFSIGGDGKIYGVYDNGDNKLLGQICVATFSNPSGLEAVGNSLFAQTLNSGEFDGTGRDISEIGSFSVGALEMSDVDLATEFTNMITTQRGFQANSRTITTSDTMLEELINLKR